MAKKQKDEQVEETATATLSTGTVIHGPKSVVERVHATTRAAVPVEDKKAPAKKAPAKKAAAKPAAAESDDK